MNKLSFQPAEVVDNSTIDGKVICGYQGWFGTPEDGYAERGWMHWGGKTPGFDEDGKQKHSFELYPDLYEYNQEELTDTRFEPLNDGRKAQLFSSYFDNTIDLHFSWMKQYNIHGVALQRFLGEATGRRSHHFHHVAKNVKTASEKYGRIFYICYDLSGYRQDNFVEVIKKDWNEVICNELKIPESTQYLHQNGKPIVQLWGMGVGGNFRRTAEESLEIIKFFKDSGYYVIGGTPTNWRLDALDSIPGFRDVYAAYDMVSPWTVGRFRTSEKAVEHFNTKVTTDMTFCKHISNQDYMPVIYSGFAWSLWNGGTPNMIPRLQGELLKTQMNEILKNDVKCVYIAMFDEYDEGTAIMKAAADSSEIPKNTYFLTLSADGTYISNDYYLRLTGTFSKIFNEKNIELTLNIPFSVGPRWYRSGFEIGMDPIPQEISENDVNISVKADDNAHSGKFVFEITGENSKKIEKAIHAVNVPVSATTELSYFINPKYVNNDVLVDCVFSDKTLLSDLPNYEKPMPKLNEWSKISVNLGKIALNKTIEKLILSFNGTSEKIDVKIDDLWLEDK